MKKYVKDLLKHQLASEEAQLKELKKIYQRAIRDCDEAIRQLSARKDMENLQAIIYQQQFQEALKKQLEGIVDQLGSRQFTSVSQYLNECYVDGYVGNAYALMQQGIPLLLPIDQEKVVRAVKTDSKLSKGLYAALGEDVTKLKKDVRMQLSRGIASGKNWHQVADDLAGDFRNTPFNKAYNRSMTIVRTEGHRISEAANFDGMRDAKAAGADVVKQWVSVLDGVTRPNHRTLDGQIRELEDPYEVDNLQAMYPGGFGVAKEDCNCRCKSTQRAKWALGEDELAELQSRADYWGLDKSQQFEEFKEKYLQAAEKSSIIKSIQIDDIKSAVEGSKIRPEVAEHIGNALKKHGGTWLFNSVKTIHDKPTIVMNTNVVQAGTFGDVILELNEACIGGKTVEEIDAMFKHARVTVANSLEEGVVHEIYHAKLVAGRNYAQIVNLYDELDSVHINSVSKTASADGSECIAEIGVLLERGGDVPEDAMRHYKKYME